MNERLEDLMYKAGLTAQGSWDSMDPYDQQAIERFAELIVRECYGEVLCQLYDYNPSSNEQFNFGHETGLKLAVSKIKEHFGVES